MDRLEAIGEINLRKFGDILSALTLNKRSLDSIIVRNMIVSTGSVILKAS